MEIRTQILTAAQWEQEVANLISYLQAKGKHELVVSHGWGCDLDMDDLYQEKIVPVLALHDFIKQSIQSGIYIFGESNLHIRSQDDEIELCHECDIHLTTDNKELAQEVVAGWTARGFTYYEVFLSQ